jgi:hypothetical protein
MFSSPKKFLIISFNKVTLLKDKKIVPQSEVLNIDGDGE